MFYSPLRYPGGKNKLSQFLAKICIDHKINGHYVEPYAGGASVALYLLIEGYVGRVTINDKDRSIYAFWHCVLNETERFCEKIRTTKINMESWNEQRIIQKEKETVDIFSLGFSTFFLNRTNRSGIIRAGVIGGNNQDGKYKLDCRFNKEDLIGRIQKIAEFKSKITLTNIDALDLIHNIASESKKKKTIFYLDPPYYIHGKSLYMSHYTHEDHEKISKAISKIKNINWIISYDAGPEIESIYDWVPQDRTIRYSFNHFAYKKRPGNELLFGSKGLFSTLTGNPLEIKC